MLSQMVVWEAATGRHYSIVATKGMGNENAKKVVDNRFLSNGEYAVEDTHLQLWESKQEQS